MLLNKANHAAVPDSLPKYTFHGRVQSNIISVSHETNSTLLQLPSQLHLRPSVAKVLPLALTLVFLTLPQPQVCCCSTSNHTHVGLVTRVQIFGTQTWPLRIHQGNCLDSFDVSVEHNSAMNWTLVTRQHEIIKRRGRDYREGGETTLQTEVIERMPKTCHVHT